MEEMVWQCERRVGGQVRERELFETRAEAERRRTKLLEIEPDLTFVVEPVDVTKIWN